MVSIKKIYSLTLLILISISSGNLFAQKIQYSGLSYISQNADIKESYQNTLKLEANLRSLLIGHLKKNITNKSILSLGVSDSFKDGTLSLIISMDTERVSSIFFNNKCLHNFRLGIQTLIFNPKDQQILSVKPYASQKIYSDSFRGIDCNIRDKKEDLIRFAELFYGLDIPKNTYQEYKNLSDLQIAELMTKNAIAAESYTKIYKLEDGDGGFEDGSRISIFKQIFEDILELDLSSTKQTNFYVGIDDVVLSELSVNQMSGQKNLKENHDFSDLFGFKESLYKVWAGQQFSKWFSANFDYPLVPYVKGKALGRDIAIKFADTGELLNLRLPSLDFGFVIKVKGFKKVKLDESDLREAYAWAAFTDIEFHNVGIEKITSVSLKNVLTEEVNKKDDVDDWSNFNLSFNRILKDYSDNLNSFDKKWLSKASKMKSKDFKKHSAIIKDNIGIKNDKK